MKGRKFLVFNMFLSSILYSFETQGSFWSEKEVWISSLMGDPYTFWVNNDGTLYWENKRYDLGPANVYFLIASASGIGIVEVKFAGMPLNKYGMTELFPHNCREWNDGTIYINSSHPWYGHRGKFATVIRHEIGHAAGLADEPDDTSVIMYPYLPSFPYIPNYKSVKQDDVNGLGCLYGGSFNWGNETFTLSEPKGGVTYECKIPVVFGGCNGSGGVYNIKIYIKYDVNNPNSKWIHITTKDSARGCAHFIRSEKSSPYTKVKVEFYQNGNLKDSIISGTFNYKYSVTCLEDKQSEYSSSKCDCDKLNFVIPAKYKKIEIFDITGRKIFSFNEKEIFIDLIKDLPKGIYFLRVITKDKVYVKKLNF